MKQLLVMALWLLAGCSVTADQIHRWGAEARYQAIRDELKGAASEEIKLACAVELGRGHFEPAIPELVRLSGDPSPQLRHAAVVALGAYAGREVYLAILQRLSDPNDLVEEAAERILRTWGEETYEVVLESLNDRSYEVRAACAALLGRMGGEAAGKALLNVAQNDSNPVVRREAVRSLGSMGYKRAAGALRRIQVTDTATEVALEAGKALEALGGVVFPHSLTFAPASAPTELAALGVELSRALQAQVGAQRLCPVVPWPLEGKTAQGGAAGLCVALAQSEVDEVAWVKVALEGNRVVATVERFRVRDKVLRQTEKCVGYLSEKDTLIQDCVNAFTQNFN